MANSLVEAAAEWTDALIRTEVRGPGDFGDAMKRVAGHIGVSPSQLWALRYRRPKAILAEVYFALRAAHEAERKRQLGKLLHEATITAAAAGADSPSVRAAMDALDAENRAAAQHLADMTNSERRKPNNGET